MNKRQYKKKLKGNNFERISIDSYLMNYCIQKHLQIYEFLFLFKYFHDYSDELDDNESLLYIEMLGVQLESIQHRYEMKTYKKLTSKERKEYLKNSKQASKVLEEGIKNICKSNLQGEIK